MKDSKITKTTSSDDYITVILTREKMNAAGVEVREANNGDIHFDLPQMPKEQQEQLDDIWGRLHENLIDANIDSIVIEATVTAAAKTHAKETNIRIIASLF